MSAAAVAILADFYPGRFPEASVVAYARALARFSDEEINRAIGALVMRDTPHPPSAGEIASRILDARLEEAGIPNAAEAWEQATDPATKGSLHPLVRDALMAVGGRSTVGARQTAGEGWAVRRDFEDAYTRRREHARQEALEQPSPTMAALPVSDKLIPRQT